MTKYLPDTWRISDQNLTNNMSLDTLLRKHSEVLNVASLVNVVMQKVAETHRVVNIEQLSQIVNTIYSINLNVDTPAKLQRPEMFVYDSSNGITSIINPTIHFIYSDKQLTDSFDEVRSLEVRYTSDNEDNLSNFVDFYNEHFDIVDIEDILSDNGLKTIIIRYNLLDYRLDKHLHQLCLTTIEPVLDAILK